jgi:glycosyltransferase involved in cell wall biosynthesis
VKITHILTRFDPDENPGGVERVVDELTQRQKANHQVKVLCRNQFNRELEEERKGIQIKRAQCQDIKGLRTLTSIPSMRNLIQNTETDIFHIHDWSPYLNYLLAGSPDKSVLTHHNLSECVGGKIQAYSVQKADKNTFVSEWLRNQFGEHPSSDVILNGANLKDFTPDNTSDEEDYFLFVGTLEERKGIIELCEAASSLNVELKIVGTGPLKEEIEKNYCFEILSHISDEELTRLYQQCKALTVPSRREGFGLVWAEALESGKPVLATKTGFAANLPNKYGKILPTNYDTSELKEGLKELKEYQYSSEEIRKYAENKFNWEKIAEQYTEVYKNL